MLQLPRCWNHFAWNLVMDQAPGLLILKILLLAFACNALLSPDHNPLQRHGIQLYDQCVCKDAVAHRDQHSGVCHVSPR